ncbi:MAG: AmmeMemoRadiSam system radical SAM enzyme [Candidatus Neomarinimicrobiota bacterium]
MKKQPTTIQKHLAQWWEVHDGDRVKCTLCPRYCKIPNGSHGFCYIRQNKDSSLIDTAYGKSTGFAVDPIEKKPLFHFFPGSDILSFGTIGCNLGCKFCQNWQVSKVHDEKYINTFYSPDEIITRASVNDCIGIAYTYNDPIIFGEWVIDISSKARKTGLKNVLVTNGYITPEARKDLFQFIDAVNVDLKSFSDTFYRKLTLSRLEPVLDTLRWLVHESQTWVEITNLLIPGENDSNAEIERLTKFIAEELTSTIPLHFSAFHPDFKMLEKPTTPLSTLKNAYSIAKQNGLSYVYLGNIPVSEFKCTYCPQCQQPIIERQYYQVTNSNLKGHKCGHCGYSIPGVFNNNDPAGD